MTVDQIIEGIVVALELLYVGCIIGLGVSWLRVMK
jgi:hypothetical protein